MSVAALTFALASAGAMARPAGVSVVVTVAYQYVPGDADPATRLTLERGDRLFLANLDPLGAHNLVSIDVVNEQPLFDSDLINTGGATEVRGVPALVPGTYGFMCTVHGYDAMHGELDVV